MKSNIMTIISDQSTALERAEALDSLLYKLHHNIQYDAGEVVARYDYDRLKEVADECEDAFKNVYEFVKLCEKSEDVGEGGEYLGTVYTVDADAIDEIVEPDSMPREPEQIEIDTGIDAVREAISMAVAFALHGKTVEIG